MLDWLAANWGMLFIITVIWTVLWGGVFLLAGANDKYEWAGLAIIMLWATNIPLWGGIIGLVIDIITRYL